MSMVVKNSTVLVKEDTDHRTGHTLNIMRYSKSQGKGRLFSNGRREKLVGKYGKKALPYHAPT